ncbi:restriction endonuclease subunit S [Flaviaesturariibacter amylovorans]|uniref:Type I restriction modification DNA specificity domain-containing protein n=1 Tax=Flaviaesturariibacter amylovorans TaxID=1084520 RepID=A0ABP8HPF6_9BACT
METAKQPSLRFKARGAWEEFRMKDLLTRASNPVKVQADESYTQIGIRSHGKGIFHKEPVSGTELGNKRVFWVVENALTVNIVFAWEQAIAITSDKEKGMIASHRFPMYLADETQADIHFLLNLLLTPKGRMLLELASPGGAGRNKTLGQAEFEKIKITIPSLPEQQKIASFFIAIDRKLTLLRRKKEALERYKRGAMQTIFSQRVRFRDEEGKEFEEWEKRAIENIAPLQRGFDLPVTAIKEGRYPVVFSNGILKYHLDYKVQGPGVITGRSGTIGKVTFVEQNFWPHNTSLWVTDFCGNHPKFIYYLYLHLDLSRFGGGSGVPTLNRNDVHVQKTSIPTNKLEQSKISAFFSAIDAKIAHAQAQLEKLTEWKKGLLQKMFV